MKKSNMDILLYGFIINSGFTAFKVLLNNILFLIPLTMHLSQEVTKHKRISISNTVDSSKQLKELF
jgi:hypothetical protein